MFPIIQKVIARNDLAPDTYDLGKLAPGGKKDPSLAASISHYTTDVGSEDYRTRAFVFGNESARISGRVTVGEDGTKTFHDIEIQPLDTKFNFKHKTWNIPLEVARELARLKYDPENRGDSYDIEYRPRGAYSGRTYDPFTSSQLTEAVSKKSENPGSHPPWLLSGRTAKLPLPFLEPYRGYLDQANSASSQASDSAEGADPLRLVSPARPFRNPYGNDVTAWTASVAGVDPRNPTQLAPQPPPQQAAPPRGIWSNESMENWSVRPPINFRF
jgi:hypothetical protein